MVARLCTQLGDARKRLHRRRQRALRLRPLLGPLDPRPQRLRQCLGVRRARRRVVGERLPRDGHQRIRGPRWHAARKGRRAVLAVQRHHLGGGAERHRLATEHFVQDHAQRVHVGRRPELVHLAAGLLGGHVVRRAQHGAGRFGGRTWARRDAPVHDEHLPEAADHQVGRLQVAVQHPLVVRVRHRIADPLQDADAAPEHVGSRELGGERLAVHLHHRVPEAAVLELTAVVHRHDARVVQLRRDRALVDEPGPRRSVVHPPHAEHLHRDHAVEPPVVHPVHLPHAAHRDAVLVRVALVERQRAHHLRRAHLQRVGVERPGERRLGGAFIVHGCMIGGFAPRGNPSV